jgi:hypothetical protein
MMPNGALGKRLRELSRWPPFLDPDMKLSDFIDEHCGEHVVLVNTPRGLYAQAAE